MSVHETCEKAYLNLIEAIGENPEREGLKATPHRAAKAWQSLTAGYHQDLNEIINNALFASDCKSIVTVKNIELYSLCEHHLLPFIGKCHIGYIPHGKVLGLSKLARVVDYFSRRLQIQENLTREIASCIAEVTGATGVGVIIEAQHLCMMMRGVEKQNASMSTSTMLGSFLEDQKTRQEFLQLVQMRP